MRRNRVDEASGPLESEERDLDRIPEPPSGPPGPDQATLRAIGRARINGLAGISMLLLVVSGLGLPIPGGHLAADAIFVVVGFQLGLGLIRLGSSPRWLRRFWISAIGPVVAPSIVAVTLAATYWWWLDRLGPAEARGAVAALLSLSNITPLVTGAGFPATDHLWLVALIVQFVVLAPLLTRVARQRDGRQPLLRLVIALVAAIAVVRLTMASTGLTHPSTLAQLPITRLDGLLVGLGVAIAPPSLVRRIPTGAAVLGLVGLMAALALAPDPTRNPVVSLGLLVPVVVAATTLLVIACTTAPGGRLYRMVAGLGPRWLGERAISIYIWHQLFGMALDDGQGAILGADWPGAGLFVTRLVFALAAGAASYRYLQLPLRTEVDRLLGRRRRPTTHRPADAAGPPALSPG